MGPDPSSAFLTEQEVPKNSHDMIYHLGNETNRSINNISISFPWIIEKLVNWNSRVLPQSCCCIFLLFYRIWNIDLSPWNVIIICWTQTARRISANRTLLPAFAPRSRRALGWKQWGYPDSSRGNFDPHQLPGGKIMKNFTPQYD